MADIKIGTIYDINKDLVNKENPLDPIEYATKIKNMATRMSDDNTYYLLINNRDMYYYTLFNCIGSSVDGVISSVSDILSSLGQVIDIIPNKVDGIVDGFEIWVLNKDFDKPIAFYMLNWREGVINCG